VERQLAALSAGPTRAAAAPGVGGPRLEFSLSPEIIARRYDAFAVERGAASRINIRRPRSPDVRGDLRVTVTLEDRKGKKYGDTQQVTIRPGAEQSIPLVATAASIRPVVRGSIGDGPTARSFVVRGPIVEPVSQSALASLRAREEPPQLTPGRTKVGVYFNGLGADAILESLESATAVTPVMIHRLELAHLAKLDVCVIPHLFDAADMNPDVVKTLRQWVESGGRLILTRDAVGFRWHPRLFPEVAQGAKLASLQQLESSVALRGIARGSRVDHELKDHVQLELGPAGKTLVAELKSAKPVIAAGSVGKGTVIVNGLFPGSDDEAGTSTNSMRLLIALVHYR